ncbi:toxic anion resistance protein [Rhizobium sp. KVB221]|uniref:Toxic anion resistance protein n=2 Tax=Rhizobium setariae TaxID=2801340 RepID=A0A937CKE8_9HYPH|nr:toxic anion resistance protein [Rhizobium setariae]
MKSQHPSMVEEVRNEIDAERERRISALATEIDFFSPKTILEFGAKAAERGNHYTDDMLGKARAGDLDDTGRKLGEIVAAAQAFDLNSFDNPWGRIPVIGFALKSLMMSKERVMARFETVKAQVDKLVATVESTAGQLQRRDADFQAMYSGVREEYENLGLHIEAITRRMAELDQSLAGLDSKRNDMATLEEIGVLEAARKTLSKRADDLRVLQHSAMQTLPMVRVLQSNNLAIIDKFTTIRSLTLPAWKRAFLLALSLNEQKEAVGLADTIDDATNAMLTRNAELLKQNSIAVAKSNQRLVIDVSTLKSVHDNILETLREVRRIHVDGEVSRSQALSEIGRLRAEMIEGVKAIGAEPR